MTPTKNFDDLTALIHLLRQECEWDKKQTNKSLLPYATEEVFELVDAVLRGDDEDSKLELGDVLLQVVLQSEIYAERGVFNVGDVIYALQDKMIRRHPHVFLKHKLTEDEVKAQWDKIKQQERAKKQGNKSGFLDDVKAGTALMRAQAVQKKASKVGFDMQTLAECFDKLQEELLEVKDELPDDFEEKQALTDKQKKRLTDEIGDCFFALVNIARKLDIDSEMATQSTIVKFHKRFAYMEQQLVKQGISLDQANSKLMNEYWGKAKND